MGNIKESKKDICDSCGDTADMCRCGDFVSTRPVSAEELESYHFDKLDPQAVRDFFGE